MKLFLISQNIVHGYDTYDSMVVSAKSEDDARKIHPSSCVTHINDGKWMGTYSGGNRIGQEYENEAEDWVCFCDIDKLRVKYLGETEHERGVIIASFNAG